MTVFFTQNFPQGWLNSYNSFCLVCLALLYEQVIRLKWNILGFVVDRFLHKQLHTMLTKFLLLLMPYMSKWSVLRRFLKWNVRSFAFLFATILLFGYCAHSACGSFFFHAYRCWFTWNKFNIIVSVVVNVANVKCVYFCNNIIEFINKKEIWKRTQDPNANILANCSLDYQGTQSNPLEKIFWLYL